MQSGRQRTVATPYFLLKIQKRHEKEPKVRVITGISVHKSAVKRNFWKREGRAMLLPAQNTNSDTTLLLILSPKVNTLTKKQFRALLLGTIAKIEK